MSIIAEKFYSMEYGAAPEDPKEAVAWLERRYARPLRIGAARGVVLAAGGFAASRAMMPRRRSGPCGAISTSRRPRLATNICQRESKRVGQPSRTGWQEFLGGSVVNRLLREPVGADVHVVPRRTNRE